MSANVFITHAGKDLYSAAAIADLLRKNGVRVTLDSDTLRLGESFISFMENALKTCDYCLVLWSAAAAKSKWVQVEWEAAFHRAIEGSTNFLVIGKLEDHAVPELLRPRLQVALYPEYTSGVRELLKMLQNDNVASTKSAKPVAKPKCAILDDLEGATVYISSEAWSKTIPIRIQLSLPAAFVVENLVTLLQLPRQWVHDNKMGVQFSYALKDGDKTLQPDLSLLSQGISENSLLWLQTTMQIFSTSVPIQGSLKKVVFRGSKQSELTRLAKNILKSRLLNAGLSSSMPGVRTVGVCWGVVAFS